MFVYTVVLLDIFFRTVNQKIINLCNIELNFGSLSYVDNWKVCES